MRARDTLYGALSSAASPRASAWPLHSLTDGLACSRSGTLTRVCTAAAKAAAAAPGTGNWAKLQAIIPKAQSKKRPRAEDKPAVASKTASGHVPIRRKPTAAQLTTSLAVDCEMVGVGDRGSKSVLARVSVVNERSETVYDSFCKPTERVTDFRTFVSGVRPVHLRDAPSLEVVRGEVAMLLARRRVIGHSVSNDFNALQLKHPEHLVRDTAKYPPYLRVTGRPHSLKELALKHLGWAIQGGQHSSVDDARASMGLYLLHMKAWEAAISKGTALPQRMATAEDNAVTKPASGSGGSGGGSSGGGGSSSKRKFKDAGRGAPGERTKKRVRVKGGKVIVRNRR